MRILQKLDATFGAWLLLVLTFVVTLTVAAATAEASCSTTRVTTTSRGRTTTSTVTRCSAPRVPRCHFTTRCTPQRTCVSRTSGRFTSTSCSTRDVCKRVQVCT